MAEKECKKGYSDATRDYNIEHSIKGGLSSAAAIGKAYGIQRREAAKAKHRAPRLPWGKK